MREELINLLRRFSARTIDINEFRSAFEDLNRRGFSSAITKREDLDEIQNFLAWWVDQYDPTLQPRAGWVGRLQDVMGEALRGEHRVTLEEFRAKARELEHRLSGDNP